MPELTTTPFNSELVGVWRGSTKSGGFARAHMALNAEINRFVLYLGPAPLPSTTDTRRTPQAGKTGLG